MSSLIRKTKIKIVGDIEVSMIVRWLGRNKKGEIFEILFDMFYSLTITLNNRDN